MDFFIILIFFVMVAVGIYRGFMKEILGLFSLACSILLSILSNKWLIENIFVSIDNNFFASIIAYISSFIFFIIIFSILMQLIIKLINSERVSIIDRFFGAIVGLIKVYLFSLFIYFIIYSFSAILRPEIQDNKIENITEITPEWLKDSKSYPIFYNSIVKLDHLLKNVLHPENTKDTNEKQSNEINNNLEIDKQTEKDIEENEEKDKIIIE